MDDLGSPSDTAGVSCTSLRLVTLALAMAGCAPTVITGDVLAVGEDGLPIGSLRLDLTPIGSTTVVPIYIKNLGGDVSAPIALALSGEAAAEFTIQPGSCVGATLAPDVTCDTVLGFRPQVAGMRAARLTITAEVATVLELEAEAFAP